MQQSKSVYYAIKLGVGRSTDMINNNTAAFNACVRFVNNLKKSKHREGEHLSA